MGHWRKKVISFFMTNQCNMNCCYCSVGEKPKLRQSIELDFAKCAIDDYFAHEPAAIGIRFFANGEPTLELDLMQEITQYALASIGKQIEIEVQTNGYFGKRTLEWLKENATIVWVSFDGLPECHDKYRQTCLQKGTSSIIIDNIKDLVNHTFVGCRMTITPDLVCRQEEALRFLHSIGVRNVCSDNLYEPVQYYREHSTPLPKRPSYMEYAKSYLTALEKAHKLDMTYVSFLTVNFDEEVDVFCRSCLPAPHVLNEGYVSCCDMAYSYTAEQMRPLIYGRWIPERKEIEYDQRKIDAITARNVRNLVNCRDCEVIAHCAGGCLGEALNETGSFYGVRPEFCEAVRFLAKHLPLNNDLYPFFHP